MDLCKDCKHYEGVGCPAELDGVDSHLCHSPKFTSINYVTGERKLALCTVVRHAPSCTGYEST